jgi:LysR family transcriptional regulator for metE and metH
MSRLHESVDRRHLELLAALRHTGHLGRAADALSLSPSAASHRLKEAERRLGVALTTPDGRGVRLTPAGLHLADVGATAQAAVRAAEETARWIGAADRPAIRVALDFYDTAPWFGPLVGVPSLPCDLDFIRIAYGTTDDAVLRRDVDLGVVVAPADTAPTGEVIADDELVGIVRSDHPAAARGVLLPDDIGDATYATVGDRPAHGFEHHEFFEPAGVRPLRLRKVESLAMILELMRAFGSITVQPSLAVATARLDGLSVVPLLDTRIAVRWDAVLRSPPSEDERDMVAAIRDLLGGLDRRPESSTLANVRSA